MKTIRKTKDFGDNDAWELNPNDLRNILECVPTPPMYAGYTLGNVEDIVLAIHKAGYIKFDDEAGDVDDIDKLVEIVAIQVEVDGMKAENRKREQAGQSIVYSEDAFNEIAEKLREVTK